VILCAAACGCAAVLLFVPQPVEPVEMPALTLDPDAVRAVVADEEALARRVPSGSESIDLLRRLYSEQGLGELVPGSHEAARNRGANIISATAQVRSEHGDEAVEALRAEAVLKVLDALNGRLSREERDGLLGSFGRILRRYDVIRGEDELVAPGFVVQVLYKARWSSIHGLTPTDGMSPIELQAYWGWLALHAERAEGQWRRTALDQYEAAGGAHVLEARGVLAYREGDYNAAGVYLDEAYGQTGSVRLRNARLAVLAAAAAD